MKTTHTFELIFGGLLCPNIRAICQHQIFGATYVQPVEILYQGILYITCILFSIWNKNAISFHFCYCCCCLQWNVEKKNGPYESNKTINVLSQYYWLSISWSTNMKIIFMRCFLIWHSMPRNTGHFEWIWCQFSLCHIIVAPHSSSASQ